MNILRARGILIGTASRWPSTTSILAVRARHRRWQRAAQTVPEEYSYLHIVPSQPDPFEEDEHGVQDRPVCIRI